MVDLMKFCSVPGRLALGAPMRTPDGIAYTNGHVMVLVPDDGGDYQDAPDRMVQAMKKLPGVEAEDREWVVVSAIDIQEASKCESCLGEGVVRRADCPDCDGEGEFSYGSHWYQCKECKGDGVVDSKEGREEVCDRCLGARVEPVTVKVKRAMFQSIYLGLLGQLPNCEIAPGDPFSAAPFRFDGGKGWLMPCYFAH